MSPVYGADEVGALMGDFGVPVTLGAAETQGIPDYDTPLLRGDVESEAVERGTSVLVAVGSLGTGLVQGATVAVDGTSYLVRDIVIESDGAMMRLLLVAA